MPAGYDRDSHRLPEGANQANVGSRLGSGPNRKRARDRDRENANTGGASWASDNGELWFADHARAELQEMTSLEEMTSLARCYEMQWRSVGVRHQIWLLC
jgi:hypothetical protein